MSAPSVVMVVLGVVLALGYSLAALPKLTAAPPMRTRAADLGYSVAAFRVVGSLELAGAVGLLVGLAWAPVGLAAAVGLVLLMVGAVVSHVRTSAALSAVFPAVVFGLLTVLYVASGATS